MNQPAPELMEAQGRRFLRKLGLTGNEIDTATLREMAVASRGSLRDFGSAVAIAAQRPTVPVAAV